MNKEVKKLGVAHMVVFYVFWWSDEEQDPDSDYDEYVSVEEAQEAIDDFRSEERGKKLSYAIVRDERVTVRVCAPG